MFLLIPVLAVLLAACTSSGLAVGGSAPPPSGAGVTSGEPVPVGTSTSTAYPAHCQARDNGQLPDPTCTPGATNPAVTQATIQQTICKSGWTATIRPSTSYTDRIKVEAIAAYGGYAGSRASGYELDHLISLEIGGAPAAVANLWPERGLRNAKDPVENAAKRAVCSGKISLVAAQEAIATNWIAFGHQLGVTGIPAS